MIEPVIIPVFSVHAEERVHGRLSLSTTEVANILKKGHYVKIGVEPSTRRSHLLFYSEPDEQCFVLIQDEKMGTIVTVLPIDYHHNISWAISLDAQNEAKKLIIGDLPQVVHDRPLHQKSTRFKAKAFISDWFGRFQSVSHLASWDSEPYQQDWLQLIQNEEVRQELIEKIQLKNQELKEQELFIPSLTLQLGNKGVPVHLSAIDFRILD